MWSTMLFMTTCILMLMVQHTVILIHMGQRGNMDMATTIMNMITMKVIVDTISMQLYRITVLNLVLVTDMDTVTDMATDTGMDTGMDMGMDIGVTAIPPGIGMDTPTIVITGDDWAGRTMPVSRRARAL